MSFVSFSCLLALARNSIIVFKRNGVIECPCLVSKLRGKNLKIFTIEYVNCRLVVYDFFMFRYIPSMFYCCELLSGENAEFCKMLFLHLLRWSLDFSCHSINVTYHIYWYTYIEASFNAKDKVHLIMVYDLFKMLLNSLY